MTEQRQKTLERLANVLLAISSPHPLRVAIDGVDAAGKTTLADELAVILAGQSRPVIRASIDGFHHPKLVRYQRGPDSPEGYYRDSFDYAAILRSLLIPLGPNGNRRYCRAVFDYRDDVPKNEPFNTASDAAIVLFDGVFLLRPELIDYWDFSIFVDVDFSVSVPRAIARDLKNDSDANEKALWLKYQQKYVPGQEFYLAESRPKLKADIILDNNDIQKPKIITP